MKVVILAAGYGTRLYPLTKKKPKALLSVKNKPVLEYILEKLHLNIIDGVFIISNKKFFSQFQEQLKKYDSCLKKRIKLLHNNSTSPKNRLGAISDINFVIQKEKLKDDLLIIAGDNLFSFSLKKFLIFSQNKKPASSIIVYRNNSKKRLKEFGVVELNTQNKIIDFQEKPSHPKSSLISTCLYFFPAQKIYLIDQYLKGNECSDNSGAYIKWLVENDTVYAFTARGRWFDIGNMEEYSFVRQIF